MAVHVAAIAMATAVILSLVGEPSAAIASERVTYDTSAYTYDGHALLSSSDAVATGARGSPSGPAAGSWGGSVAVRGLGVAANTGGDLTTVGRWMSAEEHGAMSSTGMVQEGGGGTTYVAHPADPAAFGSQAATGSRYVEFGVPPSALRPAGKEGWAQIPGPNSLYGRLAQMRGESPPQFPPASNINWLFTK